MEGINVGLVIFGKVTYRYIFMILVLLSWELFTGVGGLLGLDFQNDYFSPNRIVYDLQEGLGFRRLKTFSSAKQVFGEPGSIFNTLLSRIVST